MIVKLRMNEQTAERLLNALETLFHTLPAPVSESIVEVEIIATGEFALNCDRPEHWTIWR